MIRQHKKLSFCHHLLLFRRRHLFQSTDLPNNLLEIHALLLKRSLHTLYNLLLPLLTESTIPIPLLLHNLRPPPEQTLLPHLHQRLLKLHHLLPPMLNHIPLPLPPPTNPPMLPGQASQHHPIQIPKRQLLPRNKRMRVQHRREIQLPIPVHHQIPRLRPHELPLDRGQDLAREEHILLPLRDALQQLFHAPVPARAHDHFLALEAAQRPAPGARVRRAREEEAHRPGAEEAQEEEVDEEGERARREGGEGFALRRCGGVEGCGAFGVAGDGLEEVEVGGERGVGAVAEAEGDEGVEEEGDEELGGGLAGGWLRRMARGRTICFLWSGLWRSMWMRWTLDGSSCGSSGCRAAGAVVKGVGIAVEVVFTSAADLVNDLGVRLVAF